MVAPKADTVSCGECHAKEGSRLAKLSGFHMPARDRFKVVDTLGWGLVLVSLIGVLLHGLGRIFTNGKKHSDSK